MVSMESCVVQTLHYYKDPDGNIIENGHRYKIIEGGTLNPTINNPFVEHILELQTKPAV
jgi:hypothetical protein